MLIAVFVAAISDPLGVISGDFSRDSYTEIRSVLSRSDNSTVLLVGSWDDFY